MIMGDWVVLFGDSGDLNQWKIPPLVPVSTFTGVQPLRPPDIQTNVFSPKLANPLTKVAPMVVSSVGPRPLRVAYLTRCESGAISHQFDLKNSQNNTNAAPHMIPRSEGPIEAQDTPSVYDIGRICGDIFVQPWLRHDTEYMVTISSDPPTWDDKHSRKTIHLWETPEDSNMQVHATDFCPVSARLCVVTIRNRWEIHIIDFNSS
jgi:hypothetical protein